MPAGFTPPGSEVDQAGLTPAEEQPLAAADPQQQELVALDEQSPVPAEPTAFAEQAPVSPETLVVQGPPALVLGPAGSPAATAYPPAAPDAQAATSVPAPLEVDPAGIAGGEGFGVLNTTLGESPAGIASAQALGSDAAKLTATATGLASTGALGAAALSEKIAAAGAVATAEAVGASSAMLSTATTGIASVQAFGALATRESVAPSGIGTAAATGTTADTLRVGAVALPSAEAFGSATVTVSSGGVTVLPSGIGSAEAFGAPTLSTGALYAGGSSYGRTPREAAEFKHRHHRAVEPITLSVAPSGICSAESFGAPTIDARHPVVVVRPRPIAVEVRRAIPLPTAPLAVYACGISSGEAFGGARVALDFVVPGSDLQGCVGTPSVVVESTHTVRRATRLTRERPVARLKRDRRMKSEHALRARKSRG